MLFDDNDDDDDDVIVDYLQLSFDYRNDPARFNEFPRGLRYLIPNTHAKAPTIVGSLGDM